MPQNNTANTSVLDIPPPCQVKGCGNFAQVYSAKNMNSKGKNEYLKTCCRHTWKDLNK
jgi:hypothetical protein